MKAKGLMQPLTGHLAPDDTLKAAVKKFKAARGSNEQSCITGLPVLDVSSRLAGILTISDILKAAHPSYMNLVGLGEFTWDGMVEEIAKKAAKKKIEDIMTRDVITVMEEFPLMECIDSMLKNKIRHLPVVDKNNMVIGMLHERDIFYAITGAITGTKTAEVSHDA